MKVHYIFFTYNHNSFISWFIRAGERIIQLVNRSGLKERWSHTGLITDKSKIKTFEALNKYVQVDDFYKYRKGKYSYRVYEILEPIHSAKDISYGIQVVDKMEYGYMQLVGLFFKRIWYGIFRKYVGSYNMLGAGAVCHEMNARICDMPDWKKLKFNQNSTVGEFEKALLAWGKIKIVEEHNI